MSNPYSGEWEKVNSIADSIKNLEQQIDLLESEIASCYARLSSYPVEYDEDGNDMNEGVRDAIYSQISAYQSEVSNLESQKNSLSSAAYSLAQKYGSMAAEYREKSSHHTTSAGQFNRLSGYRFGASTASAASSAAQQRAAHYSDHAYNLDELQTAAQSASRGYRTNGGSGNISSRGTFQRPSANSYSGSTGSATASSRIPNTAEAGTAARRTPNPSAMAAFAQLGISGLSSQNGTPNYAPVAHDSVRLHTIRERIENLTAMADALLAVKWMQSANNIAQYRSENHVQWAINESQGTAELVPENILNEYQENAVQTRQTVTPMDALTAYMCAHNYGRDDYWIYSQDPEWQALHQAAFPDYIPEAHHIADRELNFEQKVQWICDGMSNVDKSDAKKIIRSMEYYSGTGYKTIHWDENAELSETKEILKVFDNHKVKPYDGIIYRGLSFKSKDSIKKVIRQYRGVWWEPGITSFSTSLDIAENYFAKNDKWGLVLICKNNRTAIPFRHLSRSSWEDEVLSPGGHRVRGWRYNHRSLRIDKENCMCYLEVEEI